MQKLEPQQILDALQALPGWTDREQAVVAQDQMVGAAEVGLQARFLVGAATVIEKMNHHPDWSNVYNRVEVRLSTHDAGGVTQLDLDLAAQMEALAKRLL